MKHQKPAWCKHPASSTEGASSPVIFLIRKPAFLLLVLLLVLIFLGFYLISVRDESDEKHQNESEIKIQNRTSDHTISGKIDARPGAHTDKSSDHSKSPPAESALQISIPIGAKRPAVFMDEGSPDDSQSVKGLLFSLEKEFQEEYHEALINGSKPYDAWESARSKSDERYRALFGDEAYQEALNIADDEARSDWQTKVSDQ